MLAHDYSRNEARILFNENFAQTFFTLTGPLINAELKGINAAIEEGEGGMMVTLKSLDVIEEVLIVFGELIHRINLQFEYISTKECKHIVDYINKYCFKSLKMLSVVGHRGTIFSGLNNTFENVFHLSFLSLNNTFEPFSIDSDKKYAVDPNKMNHIFPNLRMFHIANTTTFDWTFIHGTFAKMEIFSVYFEDMLEFEACESDIIRFLKINAHIVELTVDLTYSSMEFLSKVNDIIPGLKKLEVNCLSNGRYFGEQTDFNNVNVLVLRCDKESDIPENVNFHQLKELFMSFSYDSNENLIPFLANQVNQNLDHIDIQVGPFLSEQMLLDIPETLQQLKKIDIATESKFTADDIINFLKKCKQFRDITLFIRMNKLEKECLQDILPGICRSSAISTFYDLVSIKIDG